MNFLIISPRNTESSGLTILKASKSRMAAHFSANTGTSSDNMLARVRDAIIMLDPLSRITNVQAAFELDLPNPNSLHIESQEVLRRKFDAVIVDAKFIKNDLLSLENFLPGTPKIILAARPKSLQERSQLNSDDFIFANRNLPAENLRKLIAHSTNLTEVITFAHGEYIAEFKGGQVQDVKFKGKSLKPVHGDQKSYLPTRAGLSENAMLMTAYMVQALATNKSLEDVIVDYALRNDDHSMVYLDNEGGKPEIKDGAVKNMLFLTQMELKRHGDMLPTPKAKPKKVRGPSAMA